MRRIWRTCAGIAYLICDIIFDRHDPERKYP